MKCFYHSADLDGICSGAIVKYAFPECEMIGIDYGDDFPWDRLEDEETIYMVDFSLQPIEEMKRLASLVDLVWVDHHESKIVDEPKLGIQIEGIRKVGEAGCELAWDCCMGGLRPETVRLLGRYDVWDHADPKVLPFQYGMRSLGLDPESPTWTILFENIDREDTLDSVVAAGEAILKYIEADNAKYAQEHAFWLNFEGYRAVVINRGGANTQLFERVADPVLEDIMIAFVLKKDKWAVSLYSEKNGPDVSKIAKKHGGGGHRHAAGFVCKKLPFTIPGMDR